MTEIGYALSSEEHAPNKLVEYARQAEQSGFTFALISDHYHPWVSGQGHSPFVWSVLGGIAQATERLRVGTGVTCPILRIHPAIIAQAASTVNAMMPGRFFLGLGTGEYLNEHVLGDPWPSTDVRQEMLVEAVLIMQELWEGEEFSHEGAYFTVADARIYTRADTPPPIYLAASGPETASLARDFADGLIATSPDAELVEAYRGEGEEDSPDGRSDSDDSEGRGQGPCIGQMKVCWAPVKDEARKTVQRWWPTSEVPSLLKTDLPTPSHFEKVVEMMGAPQVSSDIVLGPNVDEYLQSIQKFVDAGYDQVYIHQIGPDQAGFLRFFREKLTPELEAQKLITPVS
jgi:G6PDH family F420-dependent oxidoreductase